MIKYEEARLALENEKNVRFFLKRYLDQKNIVEDREVTKAVEKGIESSLYDWFYTNRKQMVQYKGELLPFRDYLIEKISEHVFDTQYNLMCKYLQRDQVNTFYQQYGILLGDFHNEELKKAVKPSVIKLVEQVFSQGLFGKNQDEIVVVNSETRDGKSIKITKNDFDMAFSDIIRHVLAKKPEIITLVKQGILKEMDDAFGSASIEQGISR